MFRRSKREPRPSVGAAEDHHTSVWRNDPRMALAHGARDRHTSRITREGQRDGLLGCLDRPRRRPARLNDFEAGDGAIVAVAAVGRCRRAPHPNRGAELVPGAFKLPSQRRTIDRQRPPRDPPRYAHRRHRAEKQARPCANRSPSPGGAFGARGHGRAYSVRSPVALWLTCRATPPAPLRAPPGLSSGSRRGPSTA